ncbi:S8 family peptidase [Flindersiella endophytica]
MRTGRISGRATTVIAVGVLALTGVTTAGAQPRTPDPRAREAARSTTLSTVTLITGDRVMLATTGKGTVAVPLPAKGREGIQFGLQQAGDDIEVYPSDAVPHVISGRLDRRLFDVTELFEQRYDDRATDVIPLIVQAKPGVTQPSRGLARPGFGLPVIGGQAVSAVKPSASAYWSWLDQSMRTGAVSRVWLDGRVHADLDQSVPQVRAPQAWAKGFTGQAVKVAVLDTGVDETHLDLEGAVVESRSFLGTEDTADHNGHGTHVASIITGDGARSGGKYKGVAPDAVLLNAKVLDDEGNGNESGIVAAMAWAAETQHARVVNLSLGGDPTDGTDPVSQAVDRLSATTGALFVAAAGNLTRDSSITSPASATSALSVAATNRDLTTAWFSSRGPRVGDYAMKPDLAAPGLDIAAARATGTSLGEPVDAYYTRASGTSMAAPHVSGAAAVLAQRYPNADGAELKAILTSTASAPTDASVWDQGAGFLDTERAVSQPVWATNGNLSEFLQWPHQTPVRRTLSYHNASSRPLTLRLSFAPVNVQFHTPAPEGSFTLPPSVSVPPGSTRSVTLLIDPSKIPPGLYPEQYFIGRVIAKAPGIAVHTPATVYLEGESYNLTIDYIDRAGKPVQSWNAAQLLQPPVVTEIGMGGEWPLKFRDGKLVARLPKNDDYSVAATLATPGDDDSPSSVAVLSAPVINMMNADTTVTLDARRAAPARLTIDRPARTEIAAARVSELVGWDEGMRIWSVGFQSSGVPPAVFALPTGPARVAEYRFDLNALLRAEDRWYELAGATRGEIPENPAYTNPDSELADLTVDAGTPGPSLPGYLVRLVEYGDAFGYAQPVQLPTVRRVMAMTSVLDWPAYTSSAAVGVDPSGAQLFISILNLQTYGPESIARVELAKPVWLPRGEASFDSEWGSMQINLRPFEPGRATFEVQSGQAGISGSITVRRNGLIVGATPNPYWMYLDEQISPARYTIDMRATQQLPWFHYARTVSATWTVHAPGPSWELPMINPTVTGSFDGYGRAPAATTFPLSITLSGPPGGIAPEPPRLAISYDDGLTWSNITVRQVGHGYVANPRLPDVSDAYATIRVAARDREGNAVEVTTIRAFEIAGGKAEVPDK